MALIDAISHLIEGYFTSSDPWLPIQDRYVEGLIKSVIESADKVMQNPEDYQGQSHLDVGGNSCSQWSCRSLESVPHGFPNHAIEHSLSALYDIPHGAGLSIVIPDG